MDAVRMVHSQPFVYHNQPGAQYFYQDPSFGGQPYTHQQHHHQYQPLYPSISNLDDVNRSSPIIQEIEDKDDEQNQNSNVVDEDIPEINENGQEVTERTDDKLNSAKMLPEHTMNETSKDSTQSKHSWGVEQPQSNHHSPGQQDLKDETLPKDYTRKDDLNSSFASTSDACKRKTSPNETSPPTVGSETKPKKTKGNSGTSIILREAIPDSPAPQTCRNIEVYTESQRSSETNEIAGKVGDAMNDLTSNIGEMDIKDGSRTRPNDTIEEAEAGSDEGACHDNGAGKVFGDPPSIKGKEEKHDSGTDLFTTAANIRIGTTAGENGNFNDQSNTLREESLKSNSQKAFCHEKVHNEDDRGTGMSVKEENEIRSNYDSRQKKPVIDTEERTEILSCKQESKGNEEAVEREKKHDRSKGRSLSDSNERVKVCILHVIKIYYQKRFLLK